MEPCEREKLSPGIIAILVIFLVVGLIGLGVVALTAYRSVVDLNVYVIDLQLLGEPSVTLEYGSKYKESGAQATVRGTVKMKTPQALAVTVSGSVDPNVVGEYTLEYTAAFENVKRSVTRTVSITDTQPPVIRLKKAPGAYTLPGHPYVEEGYSASDDYDGDLTEKVVRTEEDDKVIYRVSDSSGNTHEVTRPILYKDPIPPVLTLNGETSVTISVGEVFSDPGCTASDNCDGDLTDRIAVSGTVDSSTPGTYTITYTVTDAAGNQSQLTRTVICVDTEPPALTLNGDAVISLCVGEAFTDPGYTASDNCDPSVSVTVSGTVDTSIPGTYIITYTATDAASNQTQLTRTVICADTEPPVLTLNGDFAMTLYIGDSFKDPGYTASDNCDSSVSVTVSGSVDTFLPGTYTITYTATDAAGNTATAVRIIGVRKKPNPTPNGKVIYLTFDDGPGPYTQQLLDVLAKYDVKATFFVVKTGYLNLLPKITEAGHAIAVHSTTHNYRQIYASEDAYLKDLYGMQEIIRQYTGVTTWLMRFPGGSSNRVSSFNPGIMSRLTKLVEAKGFYYFDWNVLSGDAGDTKSTDAVVQNVINGVQGKKSSVVLQHDIHKFSVAAVERIILWGLSNGYTFAPLTESSPTVHHKVVN